MKTKLSLLFAAVLMLTGCNWLKDLGEVTFSTDLTMNIPVTVTAAKSAVVNSPETGVAFTTSKDLLLGDNADVEPYLEKIRKIDLKSLVVTVSGLSAGQTINTISLDVTGVGTICTQTNITSTNNSFTPVVDAAKLTQAGEKLKNDKKITVTVSGNASGPMVFNVALTFDTEVTAGALD